MHGDDRKLSYLTQEMEIQGLFRFGLDNLYLIGVQDIHVYLSHNSCLEMTDRKLSYLTQNKPEMKIQECKPEVYLSLGDPALIRFSGGGRFVLEEESFR